MKKISLESLELINFKGLKSFTLTPKQDTSVYGTNKAGKSTVMNAFIWLFWGKDKFDRKDYQIKTLNINNEPINKIEHTVCGNFLIDGSKVKIERIYKEKWTKPRGEKFEILKGHETFFKWNNSPKTLGEFVSKIEEVIGDEVLFKMLTNPVFFNDEKLMPWLKRRGVLVSIVGGEDSDKSIVDKNPKFKELFDKLTDKTLLEYQKELKHEIKLLKDKLEEYPPRFDELERNTPELPAETEGAIKEELGKCDTEIQNIDVKITDKSKVTEDFYEEKQKRISEIGRTKIAIQEREQSLKDENAFDQNKLGLDIRELNTQIGNIIGSIDSDSQQIKLNESKITLINEQLPSIRKELDINNALEFVFNESNTNCPTCKRKFPESDITEKKDELSANFNTEKARKGNEINQRGVSRKNEIETIEKSNESIQSGVDLANEALVLKKEELTKLKQKPINNKTIDVSKDKEYIELMGKFDKLSKENEKPEPTVDNSELTQSKSTWLQMKDELNGNIIIIDQVEKLNLRKSELETEQKETAQRISTLQKDEFTIENFEKIKMEGLEVKINNLFGTVKYKLFRSLINGGHEPWCECLIDGVPFPAANSSAQINSGIEIINVLNKHFQVSLPVLIDNCESVVTKMTETDNQLIKFYALEDNSFNEDKQKRMSYFKFIDAEKAKGNTILKKI